MADKLDITEDNHGFLIGWFGEEAEGDLCLGEKCDDAEHTLANQTAEGMEDFKRNDRFYWETATGATKALRVVRAAFKLRKANRELESWEKTALAEGWKPPRG